MTLYKDDQGRLIQILDKLLDRDIHVLFKNPNVNPFNVGTKKANQSSATLQQQANANSPTLSSRSQHKKSAMAAAAAAASNTSGEPLTEIDSSGLDESEGENFDQKAWEAKFRCLNLKNSSKRISNGKNRNQIQ